MGSAGKGGGRKGGGGKGGSGGGAGRTGGASSSSQVAICLSQDVLSAVTAAFQDAVESGGPGEGRRAGLMRVSLDLATAQQLLATVALGLNADVSKKKKGKGRIVVAGPTKMPGKGKKAG